MNRTLLIVLLALGAACSHYRSGDVPEPKSPNLTLARFLDAVKAKDTRTMAGLWGNEDGPWHKVPETYRDSVMKAFQIFLRHDTYKVLDGPLQTSSNSSVMTFHVELQAPQCTRSQPFDVIKTKAGGWLMYNVHLEVESTIVPHCPKQ
ncbi:MAG TPA: hypothetical protein VH163_11740 [Gemmatimonadales bacterium]|nr:hypothetical protein [Gemmatimonadales bacterium]